MSKIEFIWVPIFWILHFVKTVFFGLIYLDQVHNRNVCILYSKFKFVSNATKIEMYLILEFESGNWPNLLSKSKLTRITFWTSPYLTVICVLPLCVYITPWVVTEWAFATAAVVVSCMRIRVSPPFHFVPGYACVPKLCSVLCSMIFSLNIFPITVPLSYTTFWKIIIIIDIKYLK